MQTHPVLPMLDQQTVQVISCHVAKNEIRSQRSDPLQQSQPTTQKSHSFHSLTCKVLEQQREQALRFKERFKKKPDTGETYFVHSVYSEKMLQGTLGGFFPLWSTQLAGRKDIKFAHIRNKGGAAIVLLAY